MKILRIVRILATLFQVITADGAYELLTTEDYHLLTCVNTIIRRHFTPRRPLLISLPPTGYDATNSTVRTPLPNCDSTFMVDILLETIHTESQRSVYVSRSKSRLHVVHSEEHIYNCVILTWESQGDRNVTDALSYQLQELHSAMPLNHKALYLIVICSRASRPPEVPALRIFQEIWANYNITDVLLLIPYGNTNMNILNNEQELSGKAFYLYTWYPYSSKGKCVNVNSLNLIDKWLVKDKGEFIYNVNLFPNKFSGDLMGCSVKVSTRVLPLIADELPGRISKKYCGLELNFLANVLKKLNLSAEFKLVFPNNKSSTEFRTDLISETAHGDADISIGALAMSQDFKSLADFTVPYAETALKWYVPCAKYVDRCEAVFKMFSLGTWISLFSIGLLVAIMMRFIATHVNSHQFHDPNNYMTLQSCLHIVCAIFLGVGISKLPRTSTLRIFFSAVLFYSFAFTIILQTNFTSVLVSPAFEIQINSMKDIIDAGIEYGYSSDIEGYLEGTDELEYQIIKEHRVKCRDQFQCFNRVMKYGNFGSIANSLSVARLMNSKLLRGTKRKVCTISNDIVKLRSVMYFKKGHPLLYRFDKILRRMIQSGLEIRWDNDLYLENKHETALPFCRESDILDYNNATDDNTLESGYYVFSVMHLQVAFYFFFLGCILSCVVLVGEILYHMKYFLMPITRYSGRK
ncbi:hypothetical protein B7P43_G10365 [Cryptotermes secundus]|uniref:Ionotropic glutamate receptor C-terminal domain-containing protein n=1 Tax=Cryptotermes secundus TaxID=105785 RepID=A0A2J7PZI5_9NEOP|nr:hypothetical protein B7P43_G10365 [Cryptotermes secundus]